MSARQVNFLLWGSAAALLLAGAGALAWAMLTPLEAAGLDEPGPATRPASRPVDIESLLSMNLRPALARGATTPQMVQGQLPSLTLVGTVGDNVALLRTQANVVEVRVIGEKLLGAELVAVRAGEVDLRYNGKMVTLKKPRMETSD